MVISRMMAGFLGIAHGLEQLASGKVQRDGNKRHAVMKMKRWEEE